MIEGPCDCNPWSRIVPLCTRCGDTRRISKGRDSVESVPCPACGSDATRHDLVAERNRSTLPKLRAEDLTDDERALLLTWRARKFHELDCLRWIEGRRYDPKADPAFLDACHRALLKSAFLHEQPEPTFKPLTR